MSKNNKRRVGCKIKRVDLYNKKRIKRADLKKINSDPTIVPNAPIDVIVSGYGDNTGEALVGRVLGINSRSFIIGFRDENGPYRETYQRKTGLRIDDMLDPYNGWRVRVSDIENELAQQRRDPLLLEEERSAEPSPDFKLSMVSQEETSYDGDPRERLVVEVWRESVSKSHYLKAYRTGIVGDGNQKSPKQLTCVVPFKVLKQLIYEFEAPADDESFTNL